MTCLLADTMMEQQQQQQQKTRMQDMIDVILNVAKGDYSRTIALSEKNDEMDSLAMGINMMIDDIRYAHEELEERIIQRTADLNKEKLFSEVVINSLPGIFMLLDEEFRIVKFNPNILRISGMSELDLKTRNAEEIVVARDREKFIQKMVWAQAEGQSAIEVGVNTTSGLDLACYFTMVRFEQQRKRYLIIMGVDITVIKYAEEAIKVSERRLAMALQTSKAGVFEYTLPVGPDTYLSERLAEILGYQHSDLPNFEQLETWLVEKINPQDLQDLLKQYAYFLSSYQSSIELEVKLRHREGYWIWVQVMAETIEWDDDNNAKHIIGIVMNVTERKVNDEKLKTALVELERSNRDLEQFAYIASHDLQEPLRMVASYVQLFEKRYKDHLDERANKYISYITDATHYMKSMIEDLLSYSRVGKDESPFEVVELNDLLNSALRHLKMSIQKNNATIHLPDRSRKLFVSRQLMIQLFQNLIGNALKYRGDVDPEVEIQLNDKKEYWEIIVSDNGVGIDPQFHDRIFGVFNRLHGKGKYEGTGIGLAMCKKIVDFHLGTIWVESEEGAGAAFHVTVSKSLSKTVDV